MAFCPFMLLYIYCIDKVYPFRTLSVWSRQPELQAMEKCSGSWAVPMHVTALAHSTYCHTRICHSSVRSTGSAGFEAVNPTGARMQRERLSVCVACRRCNDSAATRMDIDCFSVLHHLDPHSARACAIHGHRQAFPTTRAISPEGKSHATRTNWHVRQCEVVNDTY